jgi:hypothetical protein
MDRINKEYQYSSLANGKGSSRPEHVNGQRMKERKRKVPK